MANKVKGASFDELKEAFDTTDEKIEKRIGIKEKIVMPVPGGDPVTIRLLWSMDDGNKPVAVKKIENPKFTDGVGFFMTAELYSKPGAQKQVNLSKSLFGSIAAASKEKGIAFEEMIGKVGDISASYFTGAPKINRKLQCVQCHGKGCSHCTVSGTGTDAGITTGMEPPTVYNFTLRDDLMKAGSKGKEISSQF